jgi:hypothetical protein
MLLFSDVTFSQQNYYLQVLLISENKGSIKEKPRSELA